MDPVSMHEKYIQRCLDLASLGLGNTGLNPMVGSVLVHKDRIIGEGYHEQFGGAHAEVNAIKSVKNPELLKECTLYVNLEPCSHFGKTPPCALLIKEKKIPRVVISMEDPNPLVSGRGISILRNSGTEVITGILKKEAEFLNRRFLINVKEKRPYILLKWAQSKDGFIDRIREPGSPQKPNWITNHTARMLVHKWRSEEYGITAGVNTILTDNPSLNVRDWTGKNPVRIILDRRHRISSHYAVKDNSTPTWVFNPVSNPNHTGDTKYFLWDRKNTFEEWLKEIFQKDCSSLLVEGGEKFINSFLKTGFWDEARVFTGNICFEKGIAAPVIKSKESKNMIFRNNLIQIWYNRK